MATSNTPFPCSLLVQSRQHRCSTQSMFALYLLKLQQHDNLRHSLSAAVGSRAWRMGTTSSTLTSVKKKPRQ